MKLSEYINTSSLNRLEARENLAQLIGCSESAVKSWANGTRFPSRKWWKKIPVATNGHVTIYDFD